MNDFEKSIAELIDNADVPTADNQDNDWTCDSCGTDLDNWCACGMKTTTFVEIPDITDIRVLKLIEKHQDMIERVSVDEQTRVYTIHLDDGREVAITGFVQPIHNFVIQIVRRDTMNWDTYELLEQYDVPEHWSLIGTKKYASQNMLPKFMKSADARGDEREQYEHPVSKGKWSKRFYDGVLASYNIKGYKGSCKVHVRILDGNDGDYDLIQASRS